jgi:hypothetical protein
MLRLRVLLVEFPCELLALASNLLFTVIIAWYVGYEFMGDFAPRRNRKCVVAKRDKQNRN